MDEQIKNLLEKVEILSNKIEENSHEINLLKAEITRLKGEDVLIPTKQSAEKIRRQYAAGSNLENFIGLNLIHFVGIIVLLIGLAIGVKYAIDANLISPLLRIILAYIAGAVLFLLSLRLYKKLLLFSVILFGGAMASAYFTTYAAYEYYAILSRPVAFGLMFLFTVLTVFNSLKFNRQEIAILGMAGAYAIPFFVSSNNGNITGLFAYILLINAGILFISFKKYWLPLTYISFFTTWLIYTVILVTRFDSAGFYTFSIFAFVFFILFLFNSLAFKLLKKEAVIAPDLLIVIINSLFLYTAVNICFYEKYHTPISTVTLAFAIGYFIAALVTKKTAAAQAHLGNALFMMSFIAIVSFVAMKFEGFTVTIIWVLLAIIIFIIGMTWKIKLLRIGCMALFAITLLKLLFIDSGNFSSVEKIIAYIFTGAVLLAVSFLYQKFRQEIFSGDEH
ncbi:MAG: DUF2339 domain-containing protein [Ferruginibacter sp.]